MSHLFLSPDPLEILVLEQDELDTLSQLFYDLDEEMSPEIVGSTL